MKFANFSWLVLALIAAITHPCRRTIFRQNPVDVVCSRICAASWWHTDFIPLLLDKESDSVLSRSYGHLNTSNVGAVRHLGFYRKWILTILPLTEKKCTGLSNFNTINSAAELLMIKPIFSGPFIHCLKSRVKGQGEVYTGRGSTGTITANTLCCMVVLSCRRWGSDRQPSEDDRSPALRYPHETL